MVTFERTALSADLATELERMIFRGEIAPGERINESALARDWEVSRAPLREACGNLERAGLLEAKPGKGWYVAQISAETALELMEVWAELEALAGSRLAQWPLGEKLLGLRKSLEEMERAQGAGDAAEYMRHNLAFHYGIVNKSGNKELAEIYRGVVRRITLFRLANISAPQGMSQSMEGHRQILEMIETGQADKAALAIKRHILEGCSRLRKKTRKPQAEEDLGDCLA